MNDWLTEFLAHPPQVCVRLVCGCAEDVLTLWERENPSDDRMAAVVYAATRWAHHPCVENLLGLYRNERGVSAFDFRWDLSPVEGMFPPTFGGTSAGDYAGDCIVWSGRAVVQYHAGILYRTSTGFSESATEALENAVEAIARSRESGWSEEKTDNWRSAQDFLASRFATRIDKDVLPHLPEPDIAAPIEHRVELAELLAWAQRG